LEGKQTGFARGLIKLRPRVDAGVKQGGVIDGWQGGTRKESTLALESGDKIRQPALQTKEKRPSGKTPEGQKKSV